MVDEPGTGSEFEQLKPAQRLCSLPKGRRPDSDGSYCDDSGVPASKSASSRLRSRTAWDRDETRWLQPARATRGAHNPVIAVSIKTPAAV